MPMQNCYQKLAKIIWSFFFIAQAPVFGIGLILLRRRSSTSTTYNCDKMMAWAACHTNEAPKLGFNGPLSVD